MSAGAGPGSGDAAGVDSAGSGRGAVAGVGPGVGTGAALRAQLRMPRTEFDLDLELNVVTGETLALMGPSGAGKSSVLHAIAGTERITEGRIALQGAASASPAPMSPTSVNPTSVIPAETDTAGSAGARTDSASVDSAFVDIVLADTSAGVHLPPHRRSIGMLGQEPRLFPHLSAVANIAFGARAGGAAKREAGAAAYAWLDRLGLSEIASARPAALSGGQRQRVALARALAAAPRLLLLDEPFTALDVEAAADMRALVRDELARTHTTAILVSHSAADALALAHRLIVIERGRVVQQGLVREVLADPATRFVRAVAASAA